ncbi:MAG: mandelate racemase/muconate lactonizing enzyme family protein [Proteobacteria bacterium]|nr:mandelate racemase/muconate lactonizing enzyme family protein [Burkholderiales bacterium]
MKIIAIETRLTRIPFDIGAVPTAFAGMSWTALDTLHVRLLTDTGREGWGEGWGHASCATTRNAVDTLVAPAVVGAAIGEPAERAALSERLFRQLHLHGRSGSVIGALSALDIALWDLAAQCAGLPLYRLLGDAASRADSGGKSRLDSLTCYASLLRYGTPDAVARAAGRALERGYRDIKLHEVDVACVAAARAAMGHDVRLTLDTNCPWSVEEALARCRELAAFNLAWLEEPVWPPEDYAGLARVRREGGIPIAAGENVAGRLAWRALTAAGAVDFAQPSVIKCGGVGAWIDAAQEIGANGAQLVPHCAYFGAGLLATLHLQAAFAPQAAFERLFMDLEARPFGAWLDSSDGRIAVPQAAGLGCSADLAVLDRYALGPPTTIR